MRRVLLSLLVPAILFCWVSGADADDTAIGSWGGTARPMQSTTIRMAAETVQCICYQGIARYRVDFRFENRDKPQRVQLGFPFYVGGDTVSPVAGFHAWAEGTPLEVTVKHGTDNGAETDFFVHTVDFPSGITTVTVDYLVSPTTTALGESYAEAVKGTSLAGTRGLFCSFDYTLHTGANWAGSIGTAALRWSLAPDFAGGAVAQANALATDWRTSGAESDAERAQAARAEELENQFSQPDPRSYQWVFRDFEPTQTASGFCAFDIGLHCLVPFGIDKDDKPNQYADPQTKASSWLTLDEYEYSDDALVDGDPSTAWAENAAGPGIGEWVKLTLNSKRPIRELRILPGYAKRPDLFAKYNRPKRLRFDFSDGTSQIVRLADDPSLQIFPAKATAESARMTVLDVYRGTTRNETYISEVELGTAPAPKFLSFDTLIQTAEDSNTSSAPDSNPASSAATNSSGPRTTSMWPAASRALLPIGGLLAAVALGAVLMRRRAKPADGSPGR
jgi:hypothetical protein